jgi:hypothetical protein
MTFILRLTDRGAGDIPGTVQDIPFSATIQCAASTSTAIGGACATTTSADALIPGSVPEGQRSIWEVAQVQIYDGGPDGSVVTASGDKVLLREGVFVP